MSRSNMGSSHQGEAPSSRTKALVQLFKFAGVGVVNTAVDFLVYTLLVTFGMNALLAQVFSYSAGIVNSYVLNKWWTFGERKREASSGMTAQAARFLILNLLSLGLSIVLLNVALNRIGFGWLWSKLLITVITTGINFIGSKLWVFRSPRSNERTLSRHSDQPQSPSTTEQP